MKKKLVSAFISIATIASLLVGCGNTATETPAAEPAAEPAAAEAAAEEPATTEGAESAAAGEGLKCGITYWCESDFFATLANSIKEEVDAAGGTATIVDANQDSDLQLSIIEDFISQGCDVVFLNPVDKDAIKPALLQLKEAGIYVINFDSAVQDLDLIQAYIATNNYLAGVQCAEAMIKDFPDGGKIAILDYPANSACLERANGFLDTIEGKGFEVVTQLDAQGNNEQGLAITNDILQAHADLSAIFSINDQAGMGAYAAVTAAGEDIKIYGVDGAIEAKRAIDSSDTYAMTAAQSPITIGKECYKAATTLMAGEELEEFKVEVDPFAIDDSNVAEYLNADWQ